MIPPPSATPTRSASSAATAVAPDRSPSFRTAAAAYRAVWTTAFGTHLPDPDQLGEIQDLLPKDIHAFLRHTVQQGVSSEYSGPRGEL